MAHDEWYTPDEAVAPLIEDWGLAGRKLWLPFDGPDSAFARLLSPIADVRVTSFDFFDQDFEWFARNGFEVVSNPPFSIGGKIRDALNQWGIPYRLFTSASHWWKDRRPTDSVEYLGHYWYERPNEPNGLMYTAATISDGKSELRPRESYPRLEKPYRPRRLREPLFDPTNPEPEWFYQSDINVICTRHTTIQLSDYEMRPGRGGGFPRITRKGAQ